MALNLPTFYKRTSSAIVFGAIMLSALFWQNNLGFLLLVVIINVLCLREFFQLLKKIDKSAYWPQWLPAVVTIVASWILLSFTTGNIASGTLITKILWSGMTIMPVVVAMCFLLASLFPKSGIVAFLQSTGGLLYITLPMIQLFLLRERDAILPVALIVLIWVNDTMAYLVGSFIGKTPFSPISPKKTWEGTGGGMLLTIVAAVVYGFTSGQYRIIDWVMLSCIVAVMGTLGDLLESKMKRIAEVKDSGNMMPGHGGALDRFDSLLLATPVVYVYVSIFI